MLGNHVNVYALTRFAKLPKYPMNTTGLYCNFPLRSIYRRTRHTEILRLGVEVERLDEVRAFRHGRAAPPIRLERV
jgi:hypothetical protein